MREILFKAKQISDGEWVSGGSFITFFDNGVKSFFMPQFNEKCTCEHDEITDDILSFSECRFYKVDPETICQFTGLHDKHGNKIWENDIVKYEDDLVNMVKVDLIGWNETHAAFTRLHRSKMGLQYLYIDEFIASNSEVIGNIFDNPELLEVKP